MSSPRERRAAANGRRLLPALLLVAVSVLEIASGADAVVLSLVVIAPLTAASSLSARGTAGYAVLAVLTGAALGVYSDQYGSEQVTAQAIRLTTVVAVGGLAVVSAHLRTQREVRLAQVLRVAAAAQQAVLPPLPDRLGPLALAASYDSATAESSVGGDTYAAEQTAEHGVRLLIADVRGHGLDAVRLAATVLGAFRERAHEAADPGSLAAVLDRSVSRAASDEDFVTGIIAQVQDGVLSLANAGHAAPMLLSGGSVVVLSAACESPPLGLGAAPPSCTVPLSPGDRLVLFTDGATEARRPSDGAFFAFEEAAAVHLARGHLQQGLSDLRTSLLAWTGQALHDDVTVLVAEYRPGFRTSDAVVTRDQGDRR
jgi:sigma-B regulation protein RsbU (phosphoserine phosphatase)